MRRSAILPIAILAAAAITAGCANAAGTTWTFAPAGAATAAPAGPSAAPAPSGATAAVAIGAVELVAFDLGFTPSAITVDAPGRYAVTLKNTGAIPHDLTFADGTTSGTVEGGKSATVEIDVPAGGIAFKCSIPGHAQAGMQGTVTVKGSTTAAADDHGGPMPTADVAADPNAPAPVTYDATAPALLPPGEVHDIDLVVKETTMTVAPGAIQVASTRDGRPIATITTSAARTRAAISCVLL